MSKSNKSFGKQSFWPILYAIYISIIMLSINAFIAQYTVEDLVDEMDDKYDYYLIFTKDGVSTHYDVLRYDNTENGLITLTYWTEANKLEIHEVSNIKTLKIDVQSMFEDESMKVFKNSHEVVKELDMKYWLDAKDGIFSVEFNIDESEPLESLTFTKFPEPTSVTVNSQEWWKTKLNFEITGEEIVITDIPTGETMVVLYFIPNKLPNARFSMYPLEKAGVDEDIIFNADASSDPDGKIESWLWDFGDGSEASGVNVKHSYEMPGDFTIRLTVRDDSDPFGIDWVEKNIKVEYGAEIDSDDDNLKDWWEWEYFESLDHGPEDDTDNDGYTNKLESLAGTDPDDDSDYSEDSDTDKLPDIWEWQYFGNLDEQPGGDPDKDKYNNLEELDAKTEPNNKNSKPKQGEDDETGVFGLSTEMDIYIILIVIIIIIIIIVLALVITRSKKNKKGKDELNKEQDQIPGQQPKLESQQVQGAIQEPGYGPELPLSQTQEYMSTQTPEYEPTMTVAADSTDTSSYVTDPQAQSELEQQQSPKNGKKNHLPIKMPKNHVSEQINPSLPTEKEFETAVDSPPLFEEPLQQDQDLLGGQIDDYTYEKLDSDLTSESELESLLSEQKTTETSRDDVINEYIIKIGLDYDKAAKLYDSGYIKLDYLRFSSHDELAAIDGIGQELAGEIKDHVGYEDFFEALENDTSAKGSSNTGDILDDDIPGEDLLTEDIGESEGPKGLRPQRKNSLRQDE